MIDDVSDVFGIPVLRIHMGWTENERAMIAEKSEQLEREKNRLAGEGLIEQRKKLKEMEKKLEELMRDFEYRAREAVSAVHRAVNAALRPSRAMTP